MQQAVYSLFLEGRELIVKSRTGTGKTLAFLLPLEELIKKHEEAGTATDGIQAVILEPTRELAIQVKTQIDKFSSLRSVLVYGGDGGSGSQMSEIRRRQP